jgi:hypothetical protein
MDHEIDIIKIQDRVQEKVTTLFSPDFRIKFKNISNKDQKIIKSTLKIDGEYDIKIQFYNGKRRLIFDEFNKWAKDTLRDLVFWGFDPHMGLIERKRINLSIFE